MNLSTFLVLLVVCACAGLACRSIYKDKKSGKSSCGGGCSHCGSHSMCENPKAFFDQIKKEEIKEWIENIPCISIGEKTTKQLKKVGVKHILEAKDTTYLSMFDKIKESML